MQDDVDNPHVLSFFTGIAPRGPTCANHAVNDSHGGLIANDIFNGLDGLNGGGQRGSKRHFHIDGKFTL